MGARLASYKQFFAAGLGRQGFCVDKHAYACMGARLALCQQVSTAGVASTLVGRGPTAFFAARWPT
jgi:hypothetical protein